MNENHRVNIFCKEGAQYVIRWKVLSDTWMTTIYLFMTGKDQESTGDDNRMAGGIPWFFNLKWQI